MALLLCVREIVLGNAACQAVMLPVLSALPCRVRLVMRSRCTARLPIAVSMPMAALIPVPRLETRNIRFQARNQWHRTTTLDCFCQVALHISAGQFAAGISFIMACQELRVGQQLIDLAIAEDPAGSNRGAAGCCAFEGSLVQRTNRLYIT